MDKRERKSIARNRSARHEYEILETFECGVVLTGTEVKSLRDRGAQITDAFCLVRGREVWLHGVHIHPYSNGGVWNVDPDRKRKLLLHRSQITYLDADLRLSRLTCCLIHITASSWSLGLRAARNCTTSVPMPPVAIPTERFNELLRSGVVSRRCGSRF